MMFQNTIRASVTISLLRFSDNYANAGVSRVDINLTWPSQVIFGSTKPRC